ncbi:MAG: hypothetical protein ACJA1Z_000711 [Patiriisocius sp.]
MKLDGEVSAVALKKRTSADISYSFGDTVFAQATRGLMFEASIGGEHFAYKPIEDWWILKV